MTQKKNYSNLIDPVTGDYEIVNGNLVRDESLKFAAYARLKIQRTKWMYAPDSDYGSNFGLVKKRSNNASPMLQNIAEKALQPLIDDGRAVDITVDVLPSQGRHDAQLEISITDKNQQVMKFDYQPVGVY